VSIPKAILGRLLPDTITGRAVAILLVALTLSHFASMWWYQSRLADQAGMADERVAAERIAAIKKAVLAAPAEDREHTAHTLSGRGIDAHWSAIPLVQQEQRLDRRLEQLEGRLRQLVPDLNENGLRVAYSVKGDGADHVMLVSVRLADGSWINARAAALGTAASVDPHFLVPTALMALAIFAVSVFLVRVCTAEFKILTRAARRLGVDVTAPPLPVRGPEEVREAAEAFNEMQERIRTLLTDRTQMLAAISHDLRTPITTMRLRAEFLEDGEERDRILAQLDEMEAMVSATLSFLRDDGGREDAKVLHIGALLETICDDMADAGRSVRYDGPADVMLRGRPVALKRAFTNLVDNAVKYGGRAVVSLMAHPDRVVVQVDDEGPGIPEAELERVFGPFYRLEVSRNRATGGFGLGLTVARSVIAAHGGELVLANRSTAGLRATVSLPRVP
jgi:signal transduction histidine kinase